MHALRPLQESLRHRYLVDVLTPYLKGYDRVLDVGAASGLLAAKLARQMPGLRFVGLDLLADAQPRVPMVVGTGKKLPFAAGTFDCVMMIDVLHHDEDPQGLLREASRVSRGPVLVKDHYWQTRLDLTLLRWADYVGNRPYGVRLPYTFLSLAAWYKLVANAELRAVRSVAFRFHPLDPCKNVLLQLARRTYRRVRA